MQDKPGTTEQPGGDLPEAFAWNADGLPERVFLLRLKLYRKAKREPKFRFYFLYDRIYRPPKGVTRHAQLERLGPVYS